ncbi:MAG: exodeoxyribonuclease VII small subunit [Clostridia bacterium]|jgi:exodeoxyribonuclease VII small subunit|nr:exodeoxyribonuclease VII small subunit [Clostridia bacterium]MBQ9288838.1 exodeoxyribonuclease VII small subunit [Clostridia bacterium]
MEKTMTFEERLAEVETIAAQLEEGKLGLEESMKKYEQGVQMLTALEKELGSAKQRLSMIQKDASGQPEEVPAMEVEKGFIPVENGDI